MSGPERLCPDCGELSPGDAQFCGWCGVALSTEHLTHPGLAALVGDETGETNRPADPDAPSSTNVEAPNTAPSDTAIAPTPPEPSPTTAPPPAPTGLPPTAMSPSATAMSPSPNTDWTSAATTPPGVAAAPGPIGSEPSKAWMVPTLVVFVVLALAAVVLVVLATRDGGSDPSDATTPSATAAPGATDPTATSSPDTGSPDTTIPATDPPATAPVTTSATTPATTTPPTAPPVDAGTRLAEIAAADLPRALDLRERWVPQLSAKTDGTEWEGVIYDLPAILALHEQLAERVGGALLVEGSSLAFLSDGERMAGWWFTLADVDFDDADTALSWCADAGFDRSNCAARLLTDRDDATGTLRLRPA